LDFEMVGFLGILIIIPASFFFLAKKIPNKVPSTLVKIVKGVF